MTGPVLVTGASGFVGRRLVAELGRREVSAIAVGERSEPGIVGCDLRNYDAVRALIEQHRPAQVIHLAAMSSVAQSGETALRTWDVNVGGTFNLARACVEYGGDTRFVFASSAEVYGASFLDGACDEDAALRPLSTYARSKAAGEWLLRDLASPEFQVLVARPFNHIGAGQDKRFAVPSFAAQIAAAGPHGIVRVGNLDAVRDVSHVDDLVDALLTMTLSPHGAPWGAYNIGSGNAVSIRSILEQLIAISGARISIEVDEDRLRPVEVPKAQGVFGAFDRTFGPRQHRPLYQALRELFFTVQEPSVA